MKSDKATQQLINLADIWEDGTIVTTKGTYITIMELMPKNFLNESEERQASTIATFIEMLDNLKIDNFRIKIMNQATKLDAYTQRFKESATNETDPKVLKMIEDHKDFIKSLSSSSSIDRRFYFIFEFDPKKHAPKTELGRSEASIRASIAEKRERVKTFLKELGNPVKEFSELPQYDVISIIYNYYNRDLMFAEPFDARYSRIKEDYETVYDALKAGDLPKADLRDLVAPKSVRDNFRDYIRVNKRYYSGLYMDSISYPQVSTPDGWIYDLMSQGIGTDIDLWFKEEDTQEILEYLSLQDKLNVARAADIKKDDPNYVSVMEAREAIDDFTTWLRGMNRDIKSQKAYSMHVLVSISAATTEELYKKIENLEIINRRYECELKLCDMLQIKAFASAAPCGTLDPAIRKRTAHLVPTFTIATSYPFISSSLSDKDGVILGTSGSFDGLVAFNAFDPNYDNGNMVIFGKTGAGKTFTLMAYTTRQRLLGIQNYILSPYKSEEFRPICEALGGTFVEVSPSSRTRINPFDIWPEDTSGQLIYGIRPEDIVLRTEKIESLKRFYKYIIPSMTEEETAIMGDITRVIYEKKGITENNNSIYRNKELGILKKMPTYSDLLREIEKEVEAKNLRKVFYVKFREFVTGPYHNMNGQTNIDLSNKYIVFGLDRFSQNRDMLPAMMYIVLDFVMGKVKSDKTKPKIVSLDEGWLLIDEKNPQVAEFVVNTWKTIRAYRGSAIFATQSVTDTFRAGEAVATSIIENSSAKILLGMEPLALEKVKDVLQLNPSEIAQIQSYNKGRALLCAGRNHIPLQVRASKMEMDLYSTDAETLERRRIKNMEAADNDNN